MSRIDCRWTPDRNLNGLAPCNPDHPSRHSRARHHLLLDMLLQAGDLATVVKILAAYPYLRAEYADRLAAAAAGRKTPKTPIGRAG